MRHHRCTPAACAKGTELSSTDTSTHGTGAAAVGAGGASVASSSSSSNSSSGAFVDAGGCTSGQRCRTDNNTGGPTFAGWWQPN